MGVTAVTYYHPAVYDKWTTKTEGMENDMRVVNISILQFQMTVRD